MKSVKKAVIPAAGFGSRMLPASKSVPKELFPVAGIPVIQHIVEEAVYAGIEEILIVISEGKEAIKSHFSPNQALESRLQNDNKLEALSQVKNISDLADIDFIYQVEQKGLGDAVLLAREWVGNDHFMVMLGDTIINPIEETKELIKTFEQMQGDTILVRKVPQSLVQKYGIMDGSTLNEDGLYQVRSWIEKPNMNEAPSHLAISGRYVFKAEIFEYLKDTQRGKNNEIQLTDAMREMLKEHLCYARLLKGKRYDIGGWEEFILANNELSKF